MSTEKRTKLNKLYLFAICLFTISVDALAADSDQTQFASNLIGNQFPTDEDDGLVTRIEMVDEIQ